MKLAVAKEDILSVQYEKLRTAALGGPLVPEDRCGLALFLRCGMLGWAQALTGVSTATKATVPISIDYTGSHQRRTAIHLFAAMALNTNQ